MNAQVKCILLFSGKRKCGKDYVTDKLYEKLGPENSVLIKISAPIKKCWAEMNNLQLAELLSSGPMKEDYRLAMITWSENIRKKDPGIFCRTAIDMSKADDKSIWIVSDIRRKSDIDFFVSTYGRETIKLIRMTADDDIRKHRGWLYTNGVDDKASECDLDDFADWDFIIRNNGDNPNEIQEFIDTLIQKSYDMASAIKS